MTGVSMPIRTPVEIKPGKHKLEVERELSNFVKRENEFMARERRERAMQLGLALYILQRDITNLTRTHWNDGPSSDA
jgi:hypothetical protein